MLQDAARSYSLPECGDTVSAHHAGSRRHCTLQDLCRDRVRCECGHQYAGLLQRSSPTQPDPSSIAAGLRLCAGRNQLMIEACLSGDLQAVKQLHAQGEPLHHSNHSRLSGPQQPIHAACTGRHLAVVRWLQEQGVPLDVFQSSVGTPMHICSSAGFLEMAQFMHAQGASLYAPDKSFLMPMHLACRHGHLDVVRWLHTQQVPVDVSSSNGRQPIHDACLGGCLDVVRWLHEKGAGLNTRQGGGCQPLHLACLHGHLDVAQWFHAQGEPLDARTDSDETPFWFAFTQKQVQTLEWLTAQGAAQGVSADTLTTEYRRAMQVDSGSIADRFSQSPIALSQWLGWLRPLVEKAANTAAAALLHEEEVASLRPKGRPKRRKRRAQPSSASVMSASAEDPACPAATLAESVAAEDCNSLDHQFGALGLAPAGSLDTADVCVICLDALKSHVLIPCGHLCTCDKCTDVITGSDGSPCPICRAKVQQAVKVFSS